MIRRASRNDLHTILQLIDDAALWLRGKGSDQWATPWPTRRDRDRRVIDGLDAGRTWIVWDGDQAAATITVACEGNPLLWNDEERADRAVYAHRLVVDRRYAGLGLGAELMDWAGLRAWQDWGARYIRIDVWTTNLELHEYYRRHEFVPLRVCADPGYPAGMLMQKPIHRIMRKIQPFGPGPAPGRRLFTAATAHDGNPHRRRPAVSYGPSGLHGPFGPHGPAEPYGERLAACAAHRRSWHHATTAGGPASGYRRRRPALTGAWRAVPLTVLALSQLALMAFEIGTALVQYGADTATGRNGTRPRYGGPVSEWEPAPAARLGHRGPALQVPGLSRTVK